MTENRRERDLILSPNEYAFLLDETKGHVVSYVGPHKTSLANTDQPVIFEESSRRFLRSSLDEAIRSFPYAEEGWYIVLENPGPDGDLEHPPAGPSSIPKLTFGRKITIPGPATFPLWPGQLAHVIQGHHLRSNHYLVVQVYNEEAARANWSRAVIKTKDPSAAGEEEMPELTTGTQLIIKGTEVAFYIPPTGLEVVPDALGEYVREAVTLERLEYCILLDEDGHKRYIQGPQVVFPRPTETFVEHNGVRKFRAIELNELTGLYLKVIAPYTEEGREYAVGEELFITGREQMIYFPRPEHAVIRYGDREIHHSVAIPAGEARYVLGRHTGDIRLVRGPSMFLPDPRREVVVRRVLESDDVELWFPGNAEALEYNRSLKALSGVADYVSEKAVGPAQPGSPGKRRARDESVVGEGFERSQRFSAPRTITLYDKYDGAVNIDVWTGYAMQVVSRSGERKVVVGPTSYLLAYDETLETMTLSTGTPKGDQQLFKTVYLRVLNNQVSDLVRAETSDLCQVAVTLSYRVNFLGPSERWFNVENYVKYLTDHLRSLLRRAIKRIGVESFYKNAIDIIRDAVLGDPGEHGNRPGRAFEANGMHVYDVDVLDLQVGDSEIAAMLVTAQHSAVAQTVELTRQQKVLEVTRQTEEIKQSIAEARAETTRRQVALDVTVVEENLRLELARIESEARSRSQALKSQLEDQKSLAELKQAELERLRIQREQELTLEERAQEQRLAEMRAEVQGLVDKAHAVSPDLVSALQAFSDRHLVEKISHSMAPLAILGGDSVADVLSKLLRNTALESVVKSLPAANGSHPDSEVKAG